MAIPPWQHLGKPIKLIVIIATFCLLYTAVFHTKAIQLLQVKQTNSALSVAEKLYKEVRILCMVITSPAMHDVRAVHILRTWGRHCNRLLFISTKEHGELEPIVVNVKEGHEEVWIKVQKGFSYAYEYHAAEVDWFLKVEDDTFVVLENLRHLLRAYSPASPIYFGAKTVPLGHISTNAGYVLSKEAVRRFLSPKYVPAAKRERNEEQMEMERWLQRVGVSAGNTNLQDGNTFFSYPAYKPQNVTALEEHADNATYAESWWSRVEVSERPSKHTIAFHNVQPQAMYTLEYLIHKMRLFGKTTRR